MTIGTPEENDHFLDVFGAGDLVVDLSAHWELPTGPDAARVHAWVQQLLDPEIGGVERELAEPPSNR